MSNNCIYPNNYVYFIEHIHSGKYYIGSRSTNISPEDDLGKIYFSSSRDEQFMEDQKVNNSHYIYTVLKNFDNRYDANRYEMFLHDFFKVSSDPMAYNKAIHTSTGFSVTGRVSAKDTNGNTMQVSKDDTRLKNGELKGITADRIHVYDKNDKLHVVNRGDHRYDNFFRLDHAFKKCKDNNGNIFALRYSNIRITNGEVIVAELATDEKDTYLVFPDDPRIINGILKFVKRKAKKGKIHVYDNNDKRHLINNYEFDNKKFYRIPKDHKKCKTYNDCILFLFHSSPKVKKGQVKVAELATDGSDVYLVFPDDPRIINNTLKFIKKNKKKIWVYDDNDKLHLVDFINDDDNGFYRLDRGYKKCKDKNGNILILWYNNAKIKNKEVQVAKLASYMDDIYLVFEDDPRILDGTLEFVKKKEKKIYVYDKNDKRHKVDKDDNIYENSLKLPNNYKKCKDKDGKILIIRNDSTRIKNKKVIVAELATDGKDEYLVFPDDPRILHDTLKFIKNKKSS
jgi:IS1 family transposase